MKTLSLWIFSAFALLAFVGCTAEHTPDDGAETPRLVNVRINVSASSGTAATRAGDGKAAGWGDANARSGEWMRKCFVVVVQGGIIKNILRSADYETEQSYVGALSTRLETGETTFYSFANMTPQDIGLDSTIDYAAHPTALPADFDRKFYTVKGNVASVGDFPEGIPMSNKETVTITERTQQVDLEVVRMVAKVKLLLSNDTPHDITVTSVSISDITANAADNLYLLPGAADSTGLQPHISEQARHEQYTVTLAEPQVVKAKNEEPVEVDFYVNESVAQPPKYFVIDIGTTQTTVSHRVALMKWNTISRNDYLVIPVKLNDYRITFDVEQFTAIGVLPGVDNDKDMLTVRMKGYGEFHLLPHVIRLSDGKELTPGTATTDGWLFDGWSTLEMSPDGADGVSIYDRSPYPDYTRRMIEGIIGPRRGYALHQMLVSVKGLGYDIPYKVQIVKE